MQARVELVTRYPDIEIRLVAEGVRVWKSRSI
jgi:hypothetical protein